MADFIDQQGYAEVDKTVIMQSGATATGVGVQLISQGHSGIVLNVYGITTATIIVEGYDENSNLVTPMTVVNMLTGVQSGSITANGQYYLGFSGIIKIQARISAYSSGTINVFGIIEDDNPVQVSINSSSSASGTPTETDITSFSTSTTLVPAGSRQFIAICNTSAVGIWLNIKGATAVVGNGFYLQPQQTVVWETPNFIPTNSIRGIPVTGTATCTVAYY